MNIFGPSATLPGTATLGAATLAAAALTAPPPGSAGFAAATSGAAAPGATAPLSSADPDAPLDPKVWQAAQNFEAMAIGQLLAPMFDTVDLSKSKFGGGQGEAAWKPMLVDAIGKQVEAHGGFGLAQPIYAAMLRAQEGRTQTAGAPAARTPRGASSQPYLHHAAQHPGTTP
jgi:Rod binding domain-containing protein